MHGIKKFGRKGATFVEYAVLATLIGAVAIGTTLALGLATEETFDTANTRLESGVASQGNGPGGGGSGGGNGGGNPPGGTAAMRITAPTGAVQLTLYNASNLVINWGGASDCPTTPITSAQTFIQCSYAAPGEYDVAFAGRVAGFGFNDATMSGFASGLYYNIYVFRGAFSDTPGRAEILSISDWDDIGLTRLDGMFMGSSVLQSLPALPTTVMSLNYTFADGAAVPASVSSWNTSGIRELIGTFSSTPDFGTSIAGWDVSNVTHLVDTFSSSDANPAIGGWDTSGVRVMNSVFQNNTGFNQDISGWDVSGVNHPYTDGAFGLRSMFSGATAFNQDLSTWCVSDEIVPDSGGDSDYFDTGASAWVLPRPNWGAPC